MPRPTVLVRIVLACLAGLVFVSTRARQAPSLGLPALIARPRECYGLIRHIVVLMAADGSMSLNGMEPLPRARLDGRLNELLRTRTSKLVFVSPAPELPFQTAAGLIDQVRQHAEPVAILTPLAAGTGPLRCFDVQLPEAPAASSRHAPQ